jgi:hypothetical protein
MLLVVVATEFDSCFFCDGFVVMRVVSEENNADE